MDIQTRLRGISTYCSLHKALIHSPSDTCHREVHKCTLNSHFLHVYVILNTEYPSVVRLGVSYTQTSTYMWNLRWHFTHKSVTGAPYSIKSYSLSHSWTLWWRVRWLKQCRPEVENRSSTYSMIYTCKECDGEMIKWIWNTNSEWDGSRF